MSQLYRYRARPQAHIQTFTPLSGNVVNQPLELFMRQYYEPRLLSKVVKTLTNQYAFAPIPPIDKVNLARPIVNEVTIKEGGVPGTVNVEVKVTESVRDIQSNGEKISVPSGVYDVRLFRDGQLVESLPVNNIPRMKSPGAMTEEEDLELWRREKGIKLVAGSCTVVFRDVALPRRAGVTSVEFSAYAFNSSRVKSDTFGRVYDVPASPSSNKGRVYLITMGVSENEDPAFGSLFAARDARLVRDQLATNLKPRIKDYEAVITLPLISDDVVEPESPAILPTKENLHTILDKLAGRDVDEVRSAKLPPGVANKILRSTPDDVVIMSFSTHGYGDKRGDFYIIPYVPLNVGEISSAMLSQCLAVMDSSVGCSKVERFLENSISSDELELWMRNINSREMVIILDTCYSAGAIEGSGFKPGPMGSRGLGQLAYDKGMRILTATQSDNVAVGPGGLKHGLLTYALMQDGVAEKKADFMPKNNEITLAELLSYGVDDVQDLYTRFREMIPEKERQRPQVPSLFNFARKRPDIIIVGAQ